MVQIPIGPPSPYPTPQIPTSRAGPTAVPNSAADRLGTPSMEPTMPTSSTSTTQTDRIRALNDNLRQNISGGAAHAVMTAGVAALGAQAVARIVKTIETFDDFCHANDPHQERDFGSFKADGHTIFFKIDYYDRTMTMHSPDPADATVTERVITIMLAEEY